MLVAWVHGCIGVYFWLRLKRFFPKMAPVLLGLAVLLPVLALLGFYQQGRTVELLAQQLEWRAQILAPARIRTAAERSNLIRLRDYFLIFYAAPTATSTSAFSQSPTYKTLILSIVQCIRLGRSARLATVQHQVEPPARSQGGRDRKANLKREFLVLDISGSLLWGHPDHPACPPIPPGKINTAVSQLRRATQRHGCCGH